MSITDVKARTRFAPSPTGHVHIGSLRTVLFSYLWAKHTGGQFLLRIEDTDRNRLVPGAEDQIKSSLRAMGLHWDEGPDVGGAHGPYVQSERLPLYHSHAATLLKSGHLYKCWCTSERLAAVNKAREERKERPGYDRHCRFLCDAERDALEKSGAPFVMRLAVPLDGETVVNDVVRGPIVFKNDALGDMVMMKSDGFPTYHFAVVVDDHHMEITHVMRGDEWIPTSPVHVLLYKFFGWSEPTWVHVAPVLGSDGKKLSKRNGDTALIDYLDQGYLPEALLNMLALTGWNPGDTTELMDLSELIARFDLARIVPSGGVFNKEKLDNFNGIYIRRMSPAAFADVITPYLVRARLLPEELSAGQTALIARLAPMVQERVKVLGESVDLVKGFFTYETPSADALVAKKATPVTALKSLQVAHRELLTLASFDSASLQDCLKTAAEREGLKRELLLCIRVATTGSAVSLPLFESLEILGKDEVLNRLSRAIAVLAGTEQDSN